MKKITIVLIFCLFSLISFTQNGNIGISIIRIRYQSAFAALPEFYEIRLNEREVDFISPITKIPAGETKIETKQFRRKEWRELIVLLEKINIDSLNSITSSVIDGAWFSLNVNYFSGEKKKFKVWSGNAPNSLLELRRLLLKEK